MDDLISRQAVIEAINKIFPADPMRDDYTQGITCGAALANIYVAQLPSAQPEKRTEERTETHGVCLDVIDRQATLDWLKNEWNGMITSLFDGIKALPSAQPETHEERTETLACDLISRQAAIDEIGEWIKAFLENGHKESAADARLIQDGIIQLPSAQPDLSEYSDKLWKKAYERGRTEALAEIVRCKECKYNSNTCGNYVNCDIIPQMFGRTVDNFCSMAERRTDEVD